MEYASDNDHEFGPSVGGHNVNHYLASVTSPKITPFLNHAAAVSATEIESLALLTTDTSISVLLVTRSSLPKQVGKTYVSCARRDHDPTTDKAKIIRSTNNKAADHVALYSIKGSHYLCMTLRLARDGHNFTACTDTGASISSIDRTTLMKLVEKPEIHTSDQPFQLQEIGTTSATQFAVLKLWIPALLHGKRVSLERRHRFWSLRNSRPVCSSLRVLSV